MKAKILLWLIRVVEVVALVGIVFEATVDGGVTTQTYRVVTFGMVFAVGVPVESVFISTAIFGYALSLVGAACQWDQRWRKAWRCSVFFAALGLITLLLESIRYYVAFYPAQVVASAAAVAVSDLILLRPRAKTSQSDSAGGGDHIAATLDA